MIRAKIKGIGSYLPEKILTNSDLEKMVDTSDEWITTRTGIKERHIAKENETTVDMAEKASEKAINDAKIQPDDIDAILFATITPDMIFPSSACLLQDRLQTSNCMAMDFLAACSGFIYGLHIAKSLILTGEVNNVLLVAAEKLSSIVDYTDRNTCVLFGDGAGAVVISKTEEDKGILSTYVGSDGSKGELLKKEAGCTRLPFNKMQLFEYSKQFLYMDGKAIFKSAVQRMTESLTFALNKANLSFNDLNMIIPHQANLRIIEMVREYGKLKEDQVFVNLQKTGNTSAASIPIALDEAIKSNKLKKGNIVGLTAFGGGLTFGSAIVKI